MENKIQSNRNSSIELLRIIAMMCIVMSHYSIHGMIDSASMPFNLNKYILQITTLGNLGVDIFILISGYFGINGSFKLKKMLLLIGQVLFYSVGFYVLFVLFGIIDFSFTGAIKSIFPITFKQYWFFTVYIIIYLISPYLNKLMLSLSKEEATKLIAIVLLTWVIIPTFTPSDMYGNELIQLITLYLLGTYLSLHQSAKFHNKKTGIFLSIFTIVILLFSTLSLNILSLKFTSLEKYIFRLFERNSIVTVVLAVGLLIYFSSKTLSNKWIDKIASCTFGVYLIHENTYVRDWLWSTIIDNSALAESSLLILHLISSVLLVFICCTFLEVLRKNTIEKMYTHFFNNHFF